MDETKLKKLKEMMTLLNEGLSRKDFTDAFAVVVKIIKELKEANTKEWSAIKVALDKLQNRLQADNSQDVAKLRKQLERAVAGHIRAMEAGMEGMMKSHEKKMYAMDEKMAKVQNGKDADEIRITEDILRRLPPPPFLEPKEVRDKLETLNGDDRLDKSAIRGLEELEKKIDSKPSGVRGGARGVMLYVDGTKQGQAQMINLIPGTGVSLTYSRASGRNDITINASAAALAILTATGDVDGVNTVYTFASAPQIVVVNGISYRNGHGVTIVTTTATLDFAPVSGSDVYGVG